MRNTLIFAIIAIFAVLFIGGCGYLSYYNSFVDLDENVENAWSKVESAYQRRADLIPNLVNTVKGVADFEQETLTKVVEARSKATSVNIDPSKLTTENLKAFQDAQSGLSQSLGRLLLVSERYPELKASESFRELQAQLEGTENRIKVERDRFNNEVTTYNKAIRRFPANAFAGLFGLEKRARFEADQGAEDAPKVEF